MCKLRGAPLFQQQPFLAHLTGTDPDPVAPKIMCAFAQVQLGHRSPRPPGVPSPRRHNAVQRPVLPVQLAGMLRYGRKVCLCIVVASPSCRLPGPCFWQTLSSILGYDNSRACIDEWRDAGNNVAGWVGATNGTSATTEGSPYYPWCAYPCLADRPYQGDDMSDSFTTGNYAQYW